MCRWLEATCARLLRPGPEASEISAVVMCRLQELGIRSDACLDESSLDRSLRETRGEEIAIAFAGARASKPSFRRVSLAGTERPPEAQWQYRIVPFGIAFSS